MRAEAEREVRRAVAPQIEHVRVRVSAGIAVRRIHQEEHALAWLQRLAVQGLRLTHDAHQRSDRAVETQQLFDRGRGERGILAQTAQLAREAQQRRQAVGDVMSSRLVARKQQNHASSHQLVL